MKNEFAGVELPTEDELRVFCIFRNNKTGKWRIVQSDAVFSKNIGGDIKYQEVIDKIVAAGTAAGEINVSKMTVK